MSSLLHVPVKPATVSTIPTTQSRTVHSPPAKKQKAVLIQSYNYLAYTVRGKLLKEATRVERDLRLVVGHANLLDGLMLDLANFEQEPEVSFNTTVESAANASEEPKHLQHVSFADQLINAKERAAEDEISEDKISEDETSEDVIYEAIKMAIPDGSVAHPIQITIKEDDDQEIGDDELDSKISFTSSDSRSPIEHSPPDLVFEDSSDASDSEEDSIQPSLPSIGPFMFEQPGQAITTISLYQSPSKPTNCSFSCLRKTSISPMPPLGFRPGALILMIRLTLQRYVSKQLRAVPERAFEWASTV